jgi:hypothetical protein
MLRRGLRALASIVWGRGKTTSDRDFKFNFRKSEARKMGKIGLSQLSIYIHSFPPFSTYFFVPLFKSLDKRKFFLGIKYIGGGTGAPSLPSQFTSMVGAISELLVTGCVPLL